MAYKTSFISKIILFLFFSLFYMPIINIIWQSFTINNKINLLGYYELITDIDIIQGYLYSLLIAFIAVAISSFLALQSIKYFFLNGTYKFWLLFNFLNIILPETVIAISLLLFFSQLNIGLGYLTLIISHIVLILGYIIPLIYQKWLSIDKIYILAAYDLGANSKFVWKTIILPLLKPTIISTSFLGFILSFDDYIFSYFCTSTDTKTISGPLLFLLKNGLNLKAKALYSCMIIFSLLLSIIYLLYIGFQHEK